MNRLNPLTMPLSGLQVIEASAGTGKTFTLAALYVRLVLGHGRMATPAAGALYPPQILVMTFTDAATSELRARVRQRLAQAAQYFKGVAAPNAAPDDFLQQLRAEFAPDRWAACAQRLDMAAQWMDDAAIFTIHGWSSRMLKSHAFDSASLFQQSRVEDSDKLRLGAVQDYWRRWFYAVPLSALGALAAVGATPDALLEKLKPIWRDSERAPGTVAAAGKDPITLLQEWAQWQAAVAQQEAAVRSACDVSLVAMLEETIAAKQLKGYKKVWPASLLEWAQGEATVSLNKTARKAAQTLLRRFSASTLQGLGWSRAADCAAFGAIESLCQLLDQEPDVASQLLSHAAVQIGLSYQNAKNALAQFDFSDLLQCLYRALQAPDGRLAAAIRQQFPVALVDEFQDTDPWQYGALAKIYGASPHADTGLIMIGDPKQAIYSFRGADLNTYLAARQQAQAIHTLSGNFRSTGAMVNAVNHVFQSAQQPFGAVPFDPVQACNDKVQPVQVAGVAQAALTVWYLQPPAAGEKPVRKEVFLQQMAELFATQMVHLLQARAARPGEMAVLVRDGTQARAVRQALSQRGVRSVYLSERDSVFATQEAKDLWRLMCAVANPRSTAGLRAALATHLWGLSFAALEALFQDEDAWDAMVEKFNGWQVVWQRQGFLPMLHRVLHDQAIPRRMLNPSNPRDNEGERRLSNLMHLGDLLQSASAGLQGEAALIRYLEQLLQNPKAGGDAGELRLESDAHLVQVITIHKSKGLQYPLVFLPYASTFRKEDKDSGRDDAERIAEDIRLLYVAMTRAERALYMGLAKVKGDLDGATPQAQSAVSVLLQRQDAGDLAARLQVWQQCPDIQVLPAPPATSAQFVPESGVKQWKPALQPVRQLQSRWWSASFSALTRDLGHLAVAAPSPGSERDARVDDALIDSAEPSDLLCGEALPTPTVAPRFHAFPAGSRYGTLLHDLLEWQFERAWPLAQDNVDAAQARDWSALLQRKAQALKLGAETLAQLQDWIPCIGQATLPLPSVSVGADAEAPPPALKLCSLDRSNAWAEMGFALPVHTLGAAQLDRLISQQLLPGQPRSPLQDLQLEGMLIGFMDLVLQHAGRYYVLDYKSNRLDAYSAGYLSAAILAHRYDVQYTLYTLALHRLLKSRLPGYDYDRHVGGAIYLFLRGIDQPGSGVFVDRPPRALIEALDAAFSHKVFAQEVAS